MSTGRLKDQQDFDLEQIIKILDQALESDDQRIKDALRALLTVTVLCSAQHPDQALKNGPLSRLFEDMHNLNRRLGRMEDELNDVKMRMPRPRAEPYTPPTTYPGPSTGPWIGTDPNRPTPMWGPSWTSAGDDPSYKGASASSANDFTEWQDMASSGTAALAEDFLRDLNEKFRKS